MAEEQRNPNKRETQTFVVQQIPEPQPPPALQKGVFLWMRRNLFSSALNTMLTLVGVLIVIGTLVNVTIWIVQDANWFAVTFNFRQYMLGRYPEEYEWRTTLLVLFTVFFLSAGVAVWVKAAARTMLMGFITILLVVLLLPPIAKMLIDLPPYYTVAGNATVTTGSAAESPIPHVAFTGRGGEAISVRFASGLIQSEQRLADMTGFANVPANTLANAAANRLEVLAEQERLQNLLQQHSSSPIPMLTAAQVEANTTALEALEIPAPIIEAYSLNSISVQVSVLDAATGAPVGEPVTLASPDDIARFTLPADGWYILETVDTNTSSGAATEGGSEQPEATPTPQAANPMDVRNVSVVRTTDNSTSQSQTETGGEVSSGALAVLDIRGIYPVLQNTAISTGGGGFADRFTRMTDFFRLQQPLPRDDSGADLPFVVIIRNQYRGERPLGDYLRTFVAPFFERIGLHLALVLLTGVAGYIVVNTMQRSMSQQTASQFTSIGLILIPVLTWVMVNGLYLTTAVAWVGVLALGLQCVALYRLGRRNGWNGWRLQGDAPDGAGIVLVAVMVSYVMLVMLLERITGVNLPGLMLRSGIAPLVVAAAAGSSLHVPGEEGETKPVSILTPWWIAGLICGAIFVTGVGYGDPEASWALSISDPRDWGGLLLTMMLTLYGIIVAFPIGVGLALGRRSALPAIKWVCTAYIELIRGSPFITVLFFAQLLIPLINPQLAEVPNSYRAIVATIFFSAAYLAENVRGGLQSLPPGQTEAAKAVGLNAWQTTILITLPQALRAVIPALVGQFISLFKDTSLVAIVGLIDLTGFVNSMVVQAEFIGTRLEGLLFISMLYFVFSYVMGYISRLLEASGSGVTRRLT